MDAFVIQGGRRLSGRVRVNGSKNAALPLTAASLLTDQPIVLEDAPRLDDIDNMQRLLDSIGVESSRDAQTPSRMTLRSVDERDSHARYEIVRTMRASICTLGPMLARRGYARVSMPGGCAIGQRPVDLHIAGMRALGAEISLDSGDIVARAPRDSGGRRRLRGARVFLGGPFGSTVLGTANVMCAASLAGSHDHRVRRLRAGDRGPRDDAHRDEREHPGAGSPRIVIEGRGTLRRAPGHGRPDRSGHLHDGAAITGGLSRSRTARWTRRRRGRPAAADGRLVLRAPGPDRLREVRCARERPAPARRS